MDVQFFHTACPAGQALQPRTKMTGIAVDTARPVRATPPYAMRPLVALAFEGLSEQDKQLPSALNRNLVGARLLERLQRQPEHYQARAERSLLERHRAEIVSLCGTRALVIEYGAGTATATQRFLATLPAVRVYVPIDCDASLLEAACHSTRRHLPDLDVHPLCQDYRTFLMLPPEIFDRTRRRIAFYPGSTFGELPHLEAISQLVWAREALGERAAAIVGVDLLKSAEVHVRAYEDRAGAAASFNRNVLARLNTDLDATFDLDAFRHRASWNATLQRVETSLESLHVQVPTVAGITVALADREQILTQCLHARTAEDFATIVRMAGWTIERTWLDEDHRYALHFLVPAE
jgi:dimethylhistidine N-methyltransferase